MRIHHINCGTMCPISARLVNGEGSLFARGRMLCHCLLIESSQGLVLVDTGLGTRDVDDPTSRLGRRFSAFASPRLDREETALAHVVRLGFHRDDVRHIIPTHFDLDHVGGLTDFPNAEVHVFDDEYRAAMAGGRGFRRERYRPIQWAHGPRWSRYRVEGDTWFGFDSVRVLGDGRDEIALVPLVGHTLGHCGVAVRDGETWLLHAGDAYFFHGEVDPTSPRGTPALSFFQRLIAEDDRARRDNQARLRRLVGEHAASVRVFSAHCGVEFDRFAAASPASPADANDAPPHPLPGRAPDGRPPASRAP